MIPNSEILARPERRHFTADYKRRIIREAKACTQPGEVGALLRREGLYSSHLAEWRKTIKLAEEKALIPQRRGPKIVSDPRDAELARLRKEVDRLLQRLRHAEAIIGVQKKVSELLGITLAAPEFEEKK